MYRAKHGTGVFGGQLAVYIGGVRCGTLSEDRHGAISFEYESSYRGIPLSLSMPVGLARYPDRVVRPYLQGLIPDDPETRNWIGAAYGISGDNPFRLLRIMGLDCPGAVQICSVDCRLGQDEHGSLEPLADEDIEHRLAQARVRAASAWTEYGYSEGHWSLGGCQAKIALRREDDGWYACRGAAATTHILKPGVVGYDDQALVEYLSMRCAAMLGLPVASVSYRLFGSERAVVVSRYDRARNHSGDVIRLHQEDMCQALGVSPLLKYAEQGGPTTPHIIALLKRHGSHARENVIAFIMYLFFNYLMGATDAHAKNYSLLLLPQGEVQLAPLYDVATMAPYRSLMPQKRKPLRAAMSIGGENRFGFVGARHIEKMVEDNRLDELDISAADLVARFNEMARRVPACWMQAIEEARTLDVSMDEAMLLKAATEIEAHCRRSLALT